MDRNREDSEEDNTFPIGMHGDSERRKRNTSFGGFSTSTPRSGGFSTSTPRSGGFSTCTPRSGGFSTSTPRSGVFCTSTPRSHTRDSGYLTDNSPASFSGQLHFTFEGPLRGRGQSGSLRGAVGGSESDTAEGCSPFEPILLEDNEDDDSAFRDSPFSPGLDDSDIPEEPERNTLQVYRPRSDAFRHVDPAPPLPGAVLRCSMPIPVRMHGLHRYPPFVSRTVGTQTPHEHCQLFEQYLQTPLLLSVQARGPVHRRLRHYSEGEDPPERGGQDNAPLPDIVPAPRDRSVSLPDFQTLMRQREIEMGRELRRISDEFNFTYDSRRRSLSIVTENFEGEAASFPGARPAYLRSVWTSLRNLMFGSTDSRIDMEDPPEPS